MAWFEDPCPQDRVDLVDELLLPELLDLEDPVDQVARDAQDVDRSTELELALLEEDP